MLIKTFKESLLIKEASCTDAEKAYMNKYKGKQNMRINRKADGWEIVAKAKELYEFLYAASIKFDIELM